MTRTPQKQGAGTGVRAGGSGRARKGIRMGKTSAENSSTTNEMPLLNIMRIIRPQAKRSECLIIPHYVE